MSLSDTSVESASAGMSHVPLDLGEGKQFGAFGPSFPSLAKACLCRLKAVDDKEGAQKTEVVQALQETLNSLQVASPLREPLHSGLSRILMKA